MPHTILNFEQQFLDIFHDTSYPHSISRDDLERKHQVNYLKGYLTQLGCKSIVLEEQYVDHDFLDDYASYYCKCFNNYRRFCRRAHFFSLDLTGTDIPELVVTRDTQKTNQLQNAYLGFIVIKPLPDAVVGRTVLATYPPENGKRKYKAVRDYTANLFGLSLAIRSLAFQEQDTVLAACATTALWSSFQIAAARFGTNVPTPSEITKAANRYILTTRSLPTHGLRVEQMCYAIAENGLVPEVYQINPDTPLNSLLYSYLSGGFPAILGYGFIDSNERHAVTVAGYRIEDSAQVNSETYNPEAESNSVGRRIAEFYVHDDGLGPFSYLSCIDRPAQETPANPRLFIQTMDHTNLETICIPKIVVVPLYHKIRLRFNDINGATRQIDKYFRFLGIDQINDSNPRGIEWEIRLSEMTDLKAKLIHYAGVDPEAKKRLLTANLPKWLWVSTCLLDRTRLFCVIADATDIERSFYFTHFVGLYPGIHKIIADFIQHADPDLALSAQADLPAAFRTFITTQILNNRPA